ncbi:MAG: alginate export family protein, partial [Vicinamibacterales bacterium]
SPAIDIIKRDRLDGRLIGEVEWSTFERAFDGVRFDVDRPRWHTTAAVLWPTQGGFEESANPTIDKVRIGTTSVTARLRRSHELELFATHYRDSRDIAARPDNTGIPTTSIDVSVTTVGASHVGTYAAAAGRVDTLVWVSGQVGDWYGDDHRAWSLMAEGGYHWTFPWQPWVRAGLQYASGDDDPADLRHGTFFPLLPSSRPDLLAATFAQMNLRDLFVQVRATPHARVTLQGSVHRLSLANAGDRWYSGSGATARRGSFFGYLGRPSLGATRLGTLLQVMAEGTVTRWWTLKGSLGTVKGGGVVRGLFAGDRLTVFSLESALAF